MRLRWHRLVLAAVFIYFISTFAAQEIKFAALRQEMRSVQLEITEVNADITRLEGRLKYLNSMEYIEGEARRRFNLARPGEIHYRPVWQHDFSLVQPGDGPSTAGTPSN